MGDKNRIIFLTETRILALKKKKNEEYEPIKF